jgi:predicted transcriptional regulator
MNQTVELPQSLMRRLQKLTEGTRSTPESFIKDAVKQRVAYEEYKRKEIEAGLAELKAGKGIPHVEFMQRVGASKNARKKAA